MTRAWATVRAHPYGFTLGLLGGLTVAGAIVYVARSGWRPVSLGMGWWMVGLCAAFILLCASVWLDDRNQARRAAEIEQAIADVEDRTDTVHIQLHERMDRLTRILEELADVLTPQDQPGDFADPDSADTGPIRMPRAPGAGTAEAPAVDIVGGARMSADGEDAGEGFEWRQIGDRRYRFRAAS